MTGSIQIVILNRGKKQTCTVSKNEFVIGRKKGVDIVLDNDLISREQLKVIYLDGEFWLKDLGSSNGTWLNDVKLEALARYRYVEGDKLALGSSDEGIKIAISYVAAEINFAKVGNGGVISVTRESPPKPRNNLVLVEPEEAIDPYVQGLKVDSEKRLFPQIKKLFGAQADEFQNVCRKEAERILKVAERFSNNLLNETREKVKTELEALYNKQEAVESKLEKMNLNYLDIEERVTNLLKDRVAYTADVDELEKTLNEKEARLKKVIADLEVTEELILSSEKDIEERRNKIEHEERRFEAKKETELLESKIALTQISSEIEDIQAAKKSLEHDIESLGSEKARLENEKNHFQINLDKVRDEYSEIQTELDNSRNELKSNTEIASEMREAARATEQKIEELKTEALAFEAECRRKLEEEKHIHQVEVDELNLQKSKIQLQIEECKTEHLQMIDAANKEKADILSKALEEASLVKEELMSKAKREVEALLEQGKIRAQELKEAQEAELAELNHVEKLRIMQLREKSEKEWLNQKNQRANKVASSVYALVGSEMYKARNKVLDDALIETFTKELKETVVDSMLDKKPLENDKLQSILNIGQFAEGKDKEFWKKTKIIGATTACLILLLAIFPAIVKEPMNYISSLFEKPKVETGSENFLKKVKEARANSVYRPKTSADFKSSYVDNILFTTEYLDKIQSQSFQDKWILDLNDWMIRVLDVKDTTIIKFVSLESNLIKDLIKMKEQVDPKKPELGIKKMRQREYEFKKKLSETFEDQNKVPRFYDFSKKFWNDFYHPRKPSK